MLAVGACSSGNDDGLTAERDDALAALAAAKTAAAAAATAAEEAQAAALAAAALAAEAAQMTALADAATAAAAAQEMALADAATAAEAAKMMALADAATAAEAAKAMALADAATAAEAAKAMALADAATAADAAKAMALADAATAADAAKAMALADAATAADAAKAMALADAATLAGEDKAEALRLADEAHMTALADAATAADAAQVTALADAKTAADAAQVTALADAKTAADAAQVTALADAKTAADAAQVTALADAKTAADAKLKAANDGLVAALQDLDLEPASDTMSVEDQIAANTATLKDALALVEEELVEAVRVKADKDASDMAKAVHAAIGANTTNKDGEPAVQPPVPGVELEASSDSVVTATQTGYTMSETYPDEITGWRGVTLEKDGDTTVIYTDIADSMATKIGDIYGFGTGRAPGEPAHYDVVAVLDADRHDIPWSVVERDDDKSSTTGAGDEAVTTFAGSVRKLPGTFTCTGTACTVPSDDVLTSEHMWTFVPDDPNGTIDVEDSAYVSFGWWLNAMGTEGDYEFDAFASVEGMDARAVAAAQVDGSATYKGGAAGKWAMQSTSDDSASGGHFTATATLTADFEANTAEAGQEAIENGVSIGGSITNFMTGDVSRPNWKVTLTGPEMVPTTIEDTGVSGTTSWTTGGAVPGTGTWNAIFYGGMPTDQPAAAAGEFNASIPASGEIARLSGAFGANKVGE